MTPRHMVRGKPRLGGAVGRGFNAPTPTLRGIGQMTNTSSSSSSTGQPGATTQTTTSIVWTPSDATQFASETDQLWQALNSSVVSCSTGQTGTPTSSQSTNQGNGLAAAQLAQFQEDYIAWEAFYQKAQNADASSLFGDSFQGLWWNTDTISQYQGKAAAWYNIIQAACPSTTLPTLSPATPGSFLSNLFPPSADTVKALTVAAVVGSALWFTWPWLARLRR